MTLHPSDAQHIVSTKILAVAVVIAKRYWRRGIREHRPIVIERAGWLVNLVLDEMLTARSMDFWKRVDPFQIKYYPQSG